MIIEYHRPTVLSDALALLTRLEPKTIPLGGGSAISRGITEPVAVVDLQDLNLNRLEVRGKSCFVGAAAKLQALVDWQEYPAQLRQILEREFTLNIRNTATVAGSLVKATGKSLFCSALLALDSQLIWEPGGEVVPLGDWLALRRSSQKRKLITGCEFTVPSTFKYEVISRTPMDYPLVGAVLARWSSGRTRLVLVGAGESPVCFFDGTEMAGLVESSVSACSHIWRYDNSSYYQKEMVALLVNRMIGEEG